MKLTFILTGIVFFSLFGMTATGVSSPELPDSCLSKIKAAHWLDNHFDGLPSGGSFVVPNERNTQLLARLISNSHQGGLYLTVGTERGLIGAAIHKSSGLVWVDRNPQVVAYNYFVRALLAIAKDKNDYLELRLQTPQNRLQERAKVWLHEHPSQTQLIYPLFSDKFYDWWVTMVRKNTQWDGFDRKLGDTSDFGETNYLRDDLKFLWVQNLIREGNTFIVEADLRDQETISKVLIGAAQKTKSTLKLVDLSNSWENGYLGHEHTVSLLNGLRDQVPREHVMDVVFTYLAYTKNSSATEWRYYLVEMAAAPAVTDFETKLASGQTVPSVNSMDLWSIMRNLTQLTQFNYQAPTKPTLNPKLQDW